MYDYVDHAGNRRTKDRALSVAVETAKDFILWDGDATTTVSLSTCGSRTHQERHGTEGGTVTRLR